MNHVLPDAVSVAIFRDPRERLLSRSVNTIPYLVIWDDAPVLPWSCHGPGPGRCCVGGCLLPHSVWYGMVW